jgi:hypothetical protein
VTILSAQEFVRLRTSTVPEEYHRAAHDEAPLEVWLDVIANYPDMRTWVAHNKTVPIEILALLASDPDRHVRASVADRRKVTLDLFNLLSTDPDTSVRARIACNRKVPVDVIHRLANDPAKDVRSAARRRRSKADG